MRPQHLPTAVLDWNYYNVQRSERDRPTCVLLSAIRSWKISWVGQKHRLSLIRSVAFKHGGNADVAYQTVSCAPIHNQHLVENGDSPRPIKHGGEI